MKKTQILIVCFLAAFAAIGAGYAYSLKLSENRLESTSRAYRALTGEDAAVAIEELAGAFDDAERWGYGSRELGQIISASSRAATAVGYLRQGEMKESGVYAFLKACERSAFDCLAGQTELETLDRLSVFVHKIAEAGADFSDADTLETKLDDILLSPEFETLMYELGMADFALDSDFQSIAGQEIEENEAKKIAERYLGKNYAMKVSESPLAYTVFASNISAVVSKKGGYLMQLMFDLPDQEVVLNEDEAKSVMLKFLSETVSDSEILVCENFELDGIYRGEYCPQRNGILCLDERISVGVSPGSGRVCLFDAGEYYRSRSGAVSLPEGGMTAETVSEMWGGEPATACKIRLDAGVESVCYRVGDFFVDAVSGKRIDGVKNN